MQLPIVLLNKIQSYIGTIYCHNKKGLKNMLDIKQNIDEMFSEEKTIDVEYKHLLHLNINKLYSVYFKYIPKSVSIYNIEIWMSPYNYTERLLKFTNIYNMEIFTSKKKYYDISLFGGLNFINNFTKLRILYVGYNLKYKITKEIQHFTSIEKLGLSTNINNTELKYLSALPKLKELEIQMDNYVDGFQSFENSTSLTTLILNAAYCTEDMLIDISNINSIEIIEFWSCTFDYKDLLYLNNLKELYDLTISCDSLTNKQLKYISKIHKISTLKLYYNDILPLVGLLQLCDLKELSMLELNNIIDSDNFKKQFIEKIGHHVDILC